jgi:hypothetical protein
MKILFLVNRKMMIYLFNPICREYTAQAKAWRNRDFAN